MADRVQIELTPHECDLIVRVLEYTASGCLGRLNHVVGLEKIAVSWLRDDIEAIVPKFREHTAP
jgi:hypothetical protein